MFRVGDIVQARLHNKEVYPYNVPMNTKGIVKLITFHVGLMQMLGVEIPICLVKFPNENEVVVYEDDLELIEEGTNENLDSSSSVN